MEWFREKCMPVIFVAPAALVTGFGAAAEWLIGNPLAVEGRALMLVIVLSVLDFFLGTISAIVRRTWTYTRLRKGMGKLAIWGVMLVVARALSRPIGVLGADTVLRYASEWLLVYLIIVDLASVLKHCAKLARRYGVSMPGIERLIDYIEQWHAKHLPPDGGQPDPNGGDKT